MTTATTLSAPTLAAHEAPALRSAAPVQAPSSLAPRGVEEPAHHETGEPPAQGPASPSGAGRHRARSYLLGCLATGAICIASVAYYGIEIAPFESTDDAFIDGHVTAIAPQVSGRVAQLLVDDNREVQAGDVLLTIDASDYQARLEQARATLHASEGRLAEARAQVTVDQAHIEQGQAAIVAADAEAQRAGADSRRYQAIAKIAISDSQLDFATTQARSTGALVEVARHQERAAEAQLVHSQAAISTAEAEVARDAALVHQAELNLSYTHIIAPEAGVVAHRTVEAGAYVQTGQALLAIIPHHMWVIANFKETQLTHMHPGQPVTLRVDAYPGLALTGHVDGIQSGAGSRFSLLPPENASGNYVKVVQRMPVKIVLDQKPDADHVLSPGMSVVPEVQVQ